MNNYKILQIKKGHPCYDLKFSSWETIQNKFSLEPYETVYEAKSDIKITADNVYTFLEELFHKFNVGTKPSNYNGHSLSVSDLVEIENVGLFYCDDLGWQKISVEPLINEFKGFNQEEFEKALKMETTIPFEVDNYLEDRKEIRISFKKNELEHFTFESLKPPLLKVGENFNLAPTIIWNLRDCLIYCFTIKNGNQK